jgi:hypothetical protein
MELEPRRLIPVMISRLLAIVFIFIGVILQADLFLVLWVVLEGIFGYQKPISLFLWDCIS